MGNGGDLYMRITRKHAVLIPAYQPDEKLIEFVRELHEAGFPVLVTDDGSGSGYAHIFEALLPYAVVVTHERNRGKGEALKTAMSALSSAFPKCHGFITADSDGQHLTKDIIRVSTALYDNDAVITLREREGRIPFKSRLGNNLSKIVYTLLTSRFYPDNQSGLRGFKLELIPLLLQVKGHSYDYELSALYCVEKQHLKVAALPIKAIYINNNANTHFKPVADTLLIYKTLLNYALPNALLAPLRLLCIIWLTLTVGTKCCLITVPAIGILTGLVCELFCRFVAFRGLKYRDLGRMLAHSFVRYLLLALPIFFIGKCNFVLSMPAVYLLCTLLFLPGKYFLCRLIARRT